MLVGTSCPKLPIGRSVLPSGGHRIRVPPGPPPRLSRRIGAPPRLQPLRSNLLGNSDALLFLTTTVAVVPVFKKLKISPILGFLFSGAVLTQLGWLQDVETDAELSELGVLFLLFEMGLELSSERLASLAKYAFGLGTLQVLLTTALFTAIALPVGFGLGTQILVLLFHADPALVAIRSVDEAIVIGVALSLSSSAFVLQLLGERGELASRVGSAVLGVLLFQDIAVVPFLVFLPLLENTDIDPTNLRQGIALLADLGPAALSSLGALGLSVLAGRLFLRRIFETVGSQRSPESFLALCLLTVAGTGYATDQMGFSDTLGAFLAGVLLAESNYRSQVEADIQPFKGILLGLFFLTTGSSVELPVLLAQLPVVLTLLVGLIGVKTFILASLGPLFGLTRAESFRTALLLSQGGEFAFVLLALSKQLGVLPEDLNQILIMVVVLSMACTPGLDAWGRYSAARIEEADRLLDPWKDLGGGTPAGEEGVVDIATVDVAEERKRRGLPKLGELQIQNPVLICGSHPVGNVLAQIMRSPSLNSPIPYVMLVRHDIDEKQAVLLGLNAFRVDDALRVDGVSINEPRAVVVCHNDQDYSYQCVRVARALYGPGVPVLAHAQDFMHAGRLEQAGAELMDIVNQATEPGLGLGAELLRRLGLLEVETASMRAYLGALYGDVDHPPGGEILALPVDPQAAQAALPAAEEALQSGPTAGKDASD